MAKKPFKRRTKEGEEAVSVTSSSSDGLQGELQSTVNSQLALAAQNNPILLSSLQEILDELGRIRNKVYGAPAVIRSSIAPSEGVLLLPISFTYQLTTENVILSWVPASADFTYYEIRKGTDWEFGDRIIVTTNLQVILDPVLVGRHDYMIRALGANGTYSTGILSTGFEIPPIGKFSIASTVVINAITLAWNIPESIFRIAYFKVYRNSQLILTNTGTFFAYSEQVGGTNIWSVVAVDIAGNESLPAEMSIFTQGVTDYIFYSKLIWTRNGTIVNGKRDAIANNIWFCVLNETYEQHFSSRSWASPQSQIDAGYTPWLSPFTTTGSYEEIFDFGAVINNVVVTIGWGYDVSYGDFTIGVESSTSNDNINYGALNQTNSYFTSSLRYVKVKVNLTSGDDKSLMTLKNLFVSLNVKRENDGGEGTSYASDPLGTVTYFNKTFIDVEAITVTPISDTSTFATHSFSDAPYPTTFTVRVFDNAGVRITRGFRWNARGIV